MVFCASHFLPLVLLLPFPTAAPVLVVLYLASLYLTVRPCVYCSVIISFVLLSTSYHPLFPPSPVASLDLLSSTPGLVLPDLSLPLIYLGSPTQADPERGWFDFNAGHLLDPVWVAFKHRSEAIELESAKLEAVQRAEAVALQKAEAERELALELEAERRSLGRKVLDSFASLFNRAPPPPSPSPPIAPPLSVHARDPAVSRWDSRRKQLDLRWNGVGPILDFGFGRSVEEVQERLEANAKRRVETRAAAVTAVKGPG